MLMRTAAVLLLLGLCLTGCGGPPTDASPANHRLRIVATTGMVADLVKQVAGDHAEISAIMGEGVDPHLFRPTAQDIGQLMQAEIVFYSGLMLEGAMESAFTNAERNGKTVIAVTRNLPKDQLRYSAEFEGHPDPHVWHDARLWSQCLDTVVAVISEKDPEHAEEYAANAAAYRQELEKIDAYAHASLATIPESRRYLVTAHDAFGYFSQSYGITERSVQGITTESDPGVQDINNLVDFLVENQIPAIFVEATVNAANIRAVIEGAKHKGWTVNIGGTLFSDSMGAPGTYEGTYIGMLDHNVTTITRALGGEAPERGMNGQLSL